MRYLFSLFLTLFTSVVLAQSQFPKLEFANYKHHLGKFQHTKVRKCVYPFKNVGKADLIIYKVNPTCGCTSAKFTKKPIKPGQKGYIVLTYDGRGYDKGKFNKVVSITTNSENKYYQIFISGETF